MVKLGLAFAGGLSILMTCCNDNDTRVGHEAFVRCGLGGAGFPGFSCAIREIREQRSCL
jgi:hypothetical protein